MVGGNLGTRLEGVEADSVYGVLEKRAIDFNSPQFLILL